MRPAQETQQRKRWSEKLSKINQAMLIPWMDTMLGEICRVGIIDKVVEGSNDRGIEDFGEMEFAGSIEGRVDAYGNESCKESECSKEDEGKWSVYVSDCS